MSHINDIDTLADDLSKVFQIRQTPMLLVYIQNPGQEEANIRVIDHANNSDLTNLVSCGTMALVESYMARMKLPMDDALLLVLAAIKDCCETSLRKG